jgi:sugar lactone lactonase YvrE
MNLPIRYYFALLFLSFGATCAAKEPIGWPPPLRGAVGGTVTLRSDLFLKIPESVAAAVKDGSSVEFDVAKSPPTVDLAFHRDLGPDAVKRRLWSSWGDICVAKDGSVYCAIGDHGNDVGGDARCFLYRWLPEKKQLVQVVDMNEVVPPQDGQPAWSKVHAKIDEAADGRILFSCTLNDGNRAKLPTHKWNESLPGGQLYAFDPKTGRTSVVTSLPPRRCTATSLLDRERNIWWCNLEAGEGNALWGFDLLTNKPVFQSPDGTIAFNRAFALARDGAIYFNAEPGMGKYDAASGKIVAVKSSFEGSPGMRSATNESAEGIIYGTTHQSNQLFAFHPADGKLKLLGPTWLAGEYTTVTILSPDERFLYYLPGAHGRAWQSGTPVIQYVIATGRRKVIAFLAAALEKEFGYVPGGTYGAKLSADGGTLYVNFNGHAAESFRPSHMKPNGFGLTAFAAIHIPSAER